MVILLLLTGCNLIDKKNISPAIKNRPEEPFSNVIGEVFVRTEKSKDLIYTTADIQSIITPKDGTKIKGMFEIYTQKTEKYSGLVREKKFKEDKEAEKELTYEYLGDTPFFFSRSNELGKDDKRVLDGEAYMWLPMYYFDKEGDMREIHLGRLLFVFDVGVEESKTREKEVIGNGPMKYLKSKYPEMVVDGIGLINARGEQEGGTYPRIVLEKAADFLMQDQKRMDEFMNMGTEDYQEVIAIYREYVDVNTKAYFKYTKETYEELYARLIGVE